MKPVVDGLAKTYAGRYEIRIMNASGNDPEVRRLGDELAIQYVPTFVFVDSDGTVVDKVVGEVPAATLEEGLAKLK